jgi:hypothetical protein
MSWMHGRVWTVVVSALLASSTPARSSTHTSGLRDHCRLLLWLVPGRLEPFNSLTKPSPCGASVTCRYPGSDRANGVAVARFGCVDLAPAAPGACIF